MLEIIEFIWHGFLIAVGVVLLLGVLAFLLSSFDLLRAIIDAVKTLFEKKPPTYSFATAIVSRPFISASSDSEAIGKVEAGGSIWDARCNADDASRISVGDVVHVERVDGLVVIVRPS